MLIYSDINSESLKKGFILNAVSIGDAILRRAKEGKCRYLYSQIYLLYTYTKFDKPQKESEELERAKINSSSTSQ